ncbi:MAG: RNA polymerase sigma factor [Planctomycetaceae bacterium]
MRLLQQQYRRGEESLRSEPTMEASPLEQVGSQWEQQILDEELQQLPESWREPLILHELEGLSCQETADRLGLTLTALEGRLKLGRKELKQFPKSYYFPWECRKLRQSEKLGSEHDILVSPLGTRWRNVSPVGGMLSKSLHLKFPVPAARFLLLWTPLIYGETGD